jgi:hypothetical protein
MIRTRYYILDEITMLFLCDEKQEPIWYVDIVQARTRARDWTDAWQIIEVPFGK